MTVYNVGLIIGSIASASINRRLASALVKLAPQADLNLTEIPIAPLPFYSYDNDGSIPAEAAEFKAAIEAADGIVIVTPEYNRSIPGVLKNALDHGSRPYGQSVWGGKPAGVLGASPGAIGTALAQQHLRNVLAFLNMPTLAQPEVFLHVDDSTFSPEGGFATDRTRAFIQTWMNAYTAWVKKQTA